MVCVEEEDSSIFRHVYILFHLTKILFFTWRWKKLAPSNKHGNSATKFMARSKQHLIFNYFSLGLV